MLATRAADASCALVYVNQVGGQDELVFDGASLVFDSDGHCIARAEQFVETTLVVDIDVVPVFRKRLLDPRGRAMAPDLPVVAVSGEHADHESRASSPRVAEPLPTAREVYEALVLGTRDYVEKNGFTDVVLGAVRRHRLVVGHGDRRRRDRSRSGCTPSRCRRATRPRAPSPTPSDLCANLGIELRTIPIEPAFTCDARAARAVVHRASSPTSPRRTSKVASAPRS